MLPENILKEAALLNKKIVMNYQKLGREFCVINGEFSYLQYLRNTLNCILLAMAFLFLRHRHLSHKLNVPITKDE